MKMLVALQNKRLLWLLMASGALVLNLIAHYVFQIHKGLAPCELCVYIRFAMFAIVFGALICALKPSSPILRIIFGYILTGYGIIQGLIWNIRLERIHLLLDNMTDGDFFAKGAAANLCSMTPHYPLGLPMDKLFPSWFAPTGACGGVDWELFGFNMPECLFLFYAIYLISFAIMIIGFIYMLIRSAFSR